MAIYVGTRSMKEFSSLDFYQESYDLFHYVNEELQSLHMGNASYLIEAEVGKTGERIIAVMNKWIEQIKKIFQKIKMFIIKGFQKLRAKLFSKVNGDKNKETSKEEKSGPSADSTDDKDSDDDNKQKYEPAKAQPRLSGPTIKRALSLPMHVFPDGKRFVDRNYRNFFDDKIDTVEPLLSTGYDDQSLDKILKSWNPKLSISTVFKEYNRGKALVDIESGMFGKYIEVDGDYIGYNELVSILKNDTYAKNIAKKIDNLGERMRKAYVSTRDELSEIDTERYSSKYDDQWHNIYESQKLNELFLTFITSCSSGYLNQLNKILSIYQNSTYDTERDG